jgi:hypothetical protein
MTIATELFLQIQRPHILAAIQQIDAGAKTRFADSTKFDVLFQKKRYAPKEVGGLALEMLALRSFGPKDFKGGERSACFNSLSRCGFTIVPKRHHEPLATIPEVFAEILGLQLQYSSKNTDPMQRRGVLVRKLLPDLIRDRLEEIEPIFSSAGFECCVEGSDGVGRKNESPWVRIFDPEMSPSATHGWYVVLHFSRDGKRVYATVGCGATTLVGGSLVSVPEKELAQQVQWARLQIAESGHSAKYFSDSVELDGNKLSRQYEKAIAFAKTYKIGEFSEVKFWEDLIHLSKILVVLYGKDRLGKSPLSEAPEIIDARQIIDDMSRPGRRTGKGQGRGLSYPERVAIERRAMEVAAAGLLQAGFSELVDKSGTESYDFLAKKDGTTWKVEVKGTTSVVADTFLLTANELKLHTSDKGKTVLAVVSNIDLTRGGDEGPVASGGTLELLVPWNLDEWGFKPTAYQAVRR